MASLRGSNGALTATGCRDDGFADLQTWITPLSSLAKGETGAVYPAAKIYHAG
jgi:hypothetical protein